ncbi:hypothetical protein RIF29_33590 [Crotalaria pallida]|uniref:Uncharacterized protein n=1 Tax=Crotalaria pallida TaxID=3830 RepID=A0AAN9E958_CROPI
MHYRVNASSNGDAECNGYHEDDHGSTAVLLGSNVAVKNVVRPIKLPEPVTIDWYATSIVRYALKFHHFVAIVWRQNGGAVEDRQQHLLQ